MIRTILRGTVAALAFCAAAGVAHAQSDSGQKHGGLHGVVDDAHNVLKGAGRGVKSGAKAVGSTTHHALKTAGNGTKETLKKATGDTMPKDPNHKPGGLNKVARDVSKSVKKVGRSAKSGVHEGADSTHKALQATGNDVKASTKP